MSISSWVAALHLHWSVCHMSQTGTGQASWKQLLVLPICDPCGINMGPHWHHRWVHQGHTGTQASPQSHTRPMRNIKPALSACLKLNSLIVWPLEQAEQITSDILSTYKIIGEDVSKQLPIYTTSRHSNTNSSVEPRKRAGLWSKLRSIGAKRWNCNSWAVTWCPLAPEDFFPWTYMAKGTTQ